MRTGMIGRWIGRAGVIVALGVGFLAVGGAAASADTGTISPETGIGTMEFEWG